MSELQESKSQVQRLTHRLLALREEECARLARELHDGISQTLTGLAISFESGVAADPEPRDRHVAETRRWIETGLRQVRVMANDLRPAELDHLGLLSSILALIENLQAQHGISVHFRHDGLPGRLDARVESVAHRLVKEGLINVIKHAGAKQVSVRIWVQDGELNLQIEDEGVGFDAARALASPRNAGLASIRELVELLGGVLFIESAAGDGTTLLARLPLS